MAIDFKGKNCKELQEVLQSKGLRCEEVTELDGTRYWQSSNDLLVQAEIDAFDLLAREKKIKKQELRKEWLERIQTKYPDIESRAEMKVILDMWASCRPATVINARWQFVLDLETTFDNAITTINGYTTVAQVQSFNVKTTPSWPV